MQTTDDPGKPPPAGEDRRAMVLVALLGLIGYWGIARSVTNLYPFSVFPMYSNREDATTSRLAVREPGGGLHEVTSYARWSCAEPPRALPDLAVCPEAGHALNSYVDHDLIEYIKEHSRGELGGNAGQTVELIKRVWRLDGGATRETQCVIQTCRVQQHGGAR